MRTPTLRTTAATLAVLALGIGGTSALAGTAGAATLATPHVATAVTPSHFAVGVAATDDSKQLQGWMPRTGAPIDYAYRYLGGGINTGGTKNWTAWADNATYPVNYARDASVRGYTPVFTYYTLNAAIGPCDGVTCSEAQNDLSNLNSRSVMALYYADFAKLMQRLGSGTYDGVTGYGGKSIVHVEPDLAGYAESAVLTPKTGCFSFCSGTGNNPSLLGASVASSGFSLAAGLPNTYVGFNQMLLKLRDLYAPNVELAFHLSNWATGFDLNSSTSTTLDATALGTEAGQFANASGVAKLPGSSSTYDLLFNDVSNKDAGYYTYVLGKPRFWDQDNVVFPNFHRWEAYVKAATTVTAKKAIVWQVPIGNQVMASENNTPGHYQDNRVQYIFGHISELVSSNIVGAMFGTTIDDATNYWDAAADGVTNPTPLCDSDGWSDGHTVCATGQTLAADDDGGYLRTQIQSYYAKPYAITG